MSEKMHAVFATEGYTDEGYVSVNNDDDIYVYDDSDFSSSDVVQSPLHQQCVSPQQDPPPPPEPRPLLFPKTWSLLYAVRSSCSNTYCLFYVAFFSLFLAQLSLASVGPMFAWLIARGLSPTTAVTWRCQAMVLVQFPFAMLEYYFLSPGARAAARRNVYPELKYTKAQYLLMSGFTWSLQLLLWVPALTYMSTTLAAIICSTTPLMLAIYLRLTGTSLSASELVGIVVAFAGMAVAIQPADSAGQEAEQERTWKEVAIGTFLCLGSAFAALVNNLSSKKIKQHVPLLMFGFVNTVVLSLVTLVWSILLDGATVTDLTEKSVFGWFHPNWFGTILAFAAGVALVTICGFNYAIQHVSLVVFATAGLFDPALTGLMSWTIGLEGVPGPFVWAGGAITLVGGGLVIYGENKRGKREAATHIDSLIEVEAVERRLNTGTQQLKSVVVL